MRRFRILLLVFCTCLALAAWPQGQAQPNYYQYTLYDLGTFGGPNSSTSFFVISLTNKGVIGAAETAAPDLFSPNCLGDVFSLGCNVTHAFKWNHGILTDLGTLPGNSANNSSIGSAINDNGLVAGFSENGSVDPDTGYPEIRAILWNNGQIGDLGTFGGTQSSAMDVNDLGQVVGGALNATEDPLSAEFVLGFGVIWPGTTQLRAFVWQNGVMRDLGTLGGPDAFAYAINQFGQIAGQSYTNYTINPTTGIPTVDPFLWTNGKMIDLGTLGGTIGFPVWLNDWGQVVGFSNLAGDQFYHGFFWEHGAIKDLPPTSGGDNSWALWINELGDVVGGSNLPGDDLYHASLWSLGKGIDLGTVGQDTYSEAWSVNDFRQIVGTSYSSSDQPGRAFLWQDGGPMVNLNLLVENPSNLYLYGGTYINDLGEIVAQGILPDGDIHAALLVPDGFCDKECEQRILSSQNAPAVRANAGLTSPALGKQAKWLHNRLGQRYALPGQH